MPRVVCFGYRICLIYFEKAEGHTMYKDVNIRNMNPAF